jgi:glycosyltransferase involved in cell wall biosynthesis
VSTRIDGPLEIVGPETGFLVAVGDSVALAEKIVELASDPDRREAMGAAGRARVEQRFTLQKQADLIHEAYLEAASPRGPG